MKPIFTTLLVVFFLSGCVTPVEQMQIKEPAPLPAGITSRPLILDRVVFDVSKGAVIGTVMHGICINPDPIKWTHDTAVVRTGDYQREFEKLVLKYNFKLPLKPASMFETPKVSGEELVIAARISNIQENYCTRIDTWNNKQIYKGSVR